MLHFINLRENVSVPPDVLHSGKQVIVWLKSYTCQGLFNDLGKERHCLYSLWLSCVTIMTEPFLDNFQNYSNAHDEKQSYWSYCE